MGIAMRIKDIDAKKLKKAQGFLFCMEILGISEEDLLALKEIPAMKAELEELRSFKEEIVRERKAGAENVGKKTIEQTIKEGFGKSVEEFNPYGTARRKQ